MMANHQCFNCSNELIPMGQGILCDKCRIALTRPVEVRIIRAFILVGAVSLIVTSAAVYLSRLEGWF